MEPTPLQIDDFSGGLTDYPLGASPSELMAARNIVITVDKKPTVRPGFLPEGTTDTFAKLPGPINAFLPNLVPFGLPYKLSNSLEVVSSDRRGRVYAHTGVTHAEILGPTGNALFTSDHALATDSRFIPAFWNDHHYLTSASFTQKPQKIYRDDAGVLQLRTAGLPSPPLTTLTYSQAPSTNRFAYAIGWKYSYMSGNRRFVDRGPLQRFQTTLSGIQPNLYTGATPGPAGATNTVGNLPTLANGADDNYDTAGGGSATVGLVLELYRTTNSGKIFYLVGILPNGSTSFPDTTTDTELVTSEVHYSTSGQPDFDPPPVCKFAHVTERGIGLYGYIQDGTDEIKNRFVQSIPGAPDKVPGVFNGDVDEELTGISSFRGIPLFFTTKKVYRGEGFFTPSGSTALVPRKIADSVGCISHTSIVQTPEGVFFAGETGFYYTDGFTVTPVSEKLLKTYARVYSGTAGRDISVAYDEAEKRVHWTFSETEASDAIFVLHTRFGLSKGGCFTLMCGETASGSPEAGVQPTVLPPTINQNFRAKSLLATKDALGNSIIYRGDDRGYAFYSSAQTKTDPRVVVTDDVGTWGTTAISFDLRLVALNFGTNFVRKWTPKAIVTFKNRGNLSLKMSSDRNLESRPKACREFHKRSQFSWGDPGVLWGDPVIYSVQEALFEEVRMLPVPGLRCSYRSLWFQNAFSVVSKSDTLGLASLDATAKTITLLTSGKVWPLNVLDLYIAIPDASGAYSKKYLITGRTASTLTFQDPSNLLTTTASTAWQLMGTPKGHVMEIQSVVVPYLLLDSTQSVYRPGGEGGNE